MMRISFPHGTEYGVIAADGDFDPPVESVLGHRFQLVNGAVVDRYNGVSDDEVKKTDAAQAQTQQTANLQAAHAARILLVKKEAGERIAALDWKVARAHERDLLSGGNTATAVYTEREAIRQASNQAEAAVAGLTTLDEVRAFHW